MTAQIVKIKTKLATAALGKGMKGVARSLAAVNPIYALLNVEPEYRPRIFVAAAPLRRALYAVMEELEAGTLAEHTSDVQKTPAEMRQICTVSPSESPAKSHWYICEDYHMDDADLFYFHRELLDREISHVGIVMLDYFLYKRNASRYLPIFQHKDTGKMEVRYIRYGVQLAEGWGKKYENTQKGWDAKVTPTILKNFQKNIVKIEKEREARLLQTLKLTKQT
jgi:hypothetical protein